MSQHLIVVHIEGENATLRDRDGHGFQVPSDWLPSGSQEGSAVLVDVSQEEARTELNLRLAEGITEPEGTDIGA